KEAHASTPAPKKRRGRPPGSKNKPKRAMTCAGAARVRPLLHKCNDPLWQPETRVFYMVGDDIPPPWEIDRLPKRKLTRAGYRNRDEFIRYFNLCVDLFGRPFVDLIHDQGFDVFQAMDAATQWLDDQDLWAEFAGKRLSRPLTVGEYAELGCWLWHRKT